MYAFDYVNSLINVLSPQTTVDLQDLYNAIISEQATAQGMSYPPLASASGKENLSTGVQVGITVQLSPTWQLKFYPGDYVATVSGGNLTGGPGGNPVAYTAGVQVLLIQSAASTIVVAGSSNFTVAEVAAAVWNTVL